MAPLLTAACGIAIMGAVGVVSPKGLLIALALFSPVFLPGLIGLAMVMASSRRGGPVARLLGPVLTIPSFLLALYLAHYGLHHHTTDVPAPGSTVAAWVTEVLSLVGVGAALATILTAERRPSAVQLLLAANAGVLIVALAFVLGVARPGRA